MINPITSTGKTMKETQSAKPTQILVVEDDRFLAEKLSLLLGREGYSVTHHVTGEDGLVALESTNFDLVVLDVGLPGRDGLSTCRALRAKWSMPVIMLTARTDAMDKVIGLEVGADDYLTKPFEPSELVARVRAHLRRRLEYSSQPKPQSSESIIIGDITIDFDQRDATRDGERCKLNTREFELVAYLAKNANRALSREAIFEEIWGYEMDFNSNSLEVYVYRVRKKIELDPNNPDYLHTVRGYGYKIVTP